MSKFDRGMEMEEKNFATQVIETIKGNAFIIRKILFNIDDCVPKSDLEEARGKISQLEKIVGNQREELKRGQNSLRQAQEKISKLGIELEKTNTRLVQFKEKYFEIEQAFSSYENLSDSTKFALEGVFGAGNSPTNFLAGALQEGHLESLFDYVANTLNSGNNLNEIKTLLKLFDFSFAAVNSGRREKIFTRLEIHEGDYFSGSEMRKTSDSPQSGTVKKILLVGYKYIRTNKIVRPSLVILG